MDLPLTYYFHTKLQLKRNLLKFLSRPLVHSRKSCCGSPPLVTLCLQLECSFILKSVCSASWVAMVLCDMRWQPHTRVKEMSSALDTDDGK